MFFRLNMTVVYIYQIIKQSRKNDIIFILRLGDFKHEGKNSEIVP